MTAKGCHSTNTVFFHSSCSLLFFIESSTNCRDVICPELKKIDCPLDSNSHTVYPSHLIESFATVEYVSHGRQQHLQLNETAEANEEENTTTGGEAAEDDRHGEDSEKLSKILQKRKRSILYQRREPIKIVPGGHFDIHKRSIPDKYDYVLENATETRDLQAHCCPYKECKCKPECPVPHCVTPLVPILLRSADKVPGDCCDEYKCERSTVCESKSTGATYHQGDTWIESDCKECRCDEGEIHCQMYLCKPLACSKTIKLENECCEKCDESETDFCPGEANCRLSCPNGYLTEPITGCNMCKCRSISIQTPPATTNHFDVATNVTASVDTVVTVSPTVNGDRVADTDASTPVTLAPTIDTNAVEQPTVPGDNKQTVTIDNIQQICENQLNQWQKIFAICTSVLVFIILVMAIGAWAYRRKHKCQSYSTVPSNDSINTASTRNSFKQNA